MSPYPPRLAGSPDREDPATMTTTPTSERTLTMVRHAKAEHVQGKTDSDRELAARGRRDAHAIGVWLSDPSHAVLHELALCSPSERTRQTLHGIWADRKSTRLNS